MKKTITIILTSLICILAVVGVCLTVYEIGHSAKRFVYKVYRDRMELKYYGAKDTLVDAVDEYIHTVASSSCMNALSIVNACEKENVDLIFVLTQAQKESHFCTAGIAAKTNSAFNVYAYDGKSAEDIMACGHGYKHPDLSILPYLSLLKKNYLVNGITEMDLLDKFVDKNGHRYASSETYEASLRDIYSNIKSTKVYDLYKTFNKYRTLSGK